jgi:hypothetical protein
LLPTRRKDCCFTGRSQFLCTYSHAFGL